MIIKRFKLAFLVSMILSMFLIISLFTSCGSTPQSVAAPKEKNDKVTLKCVIPYDDSKKVEAFKNFNSDIRTIFPDYNIDLRFVKGDFRAYHTKIKVLLSSHDAPDVFFSEDGNFTEELRSAKAISILDKELENEEYWDLVIPSVKENQSKGHIYAVPFEDVSYGIMEVNTELFSQNNVKIPESIDELITAVKQFKSKGIIPIALGGKEGIIVYRTIEGFACTIDPKVTNNIISGKEAFSGDTFKRAAVVVKELLEMGAFEEKVETFTDTDAANLFYSGKAAMYCTTSNKLDSSYVKMNGKSALLYYPSISEKKQSQYTKALSGGLKKDCGLLVSASTNYPKEAVKLAIEMSKYYNKFLYEKQSNSRIIYIPDKMDWSEIHNISPSAKELMEYVSTSHNINSGLFENNIASDKIKSIEEDSSVFMTGLLSVDNYLKEMDNCIKSK